VGDLQPAEPREPRRGAEYEHPQQPVRNHWIDAGRGRRQSGDRAGRSSRDAMGAQGDLLTFRILNSEFRILLIGLVAALAVPRAATRPNVLLITLDTVRA